MLAGLPGTPHYQFAFKVHESSDRTSLGSCGRIVELRSSAAEPRRRSAPIQFAPAQSWRVKPLQAAETHLERRFQRSM